MSTKLAAAHDAARRGFDVFPVTPNDKKPPLLSDWQNKATQDPRQIDAWWSQWPDANVGTPTNAFITLDIDPRNGGRETLDALLDIQSFTRTLRSATAGGGVHIFYAAPDGRPVKGGTHKLGPGVDIKARGGYVVLPGSTIDGKAYAWKEERAIALAPQWIVDQCSIAQAKTGAAGKRLVEEDEIAIELATQWMLDRAPSAEYGNIDDTTYAVAAGLFDFGVSIETATELMLEWNEIKCNPPGNLERLPRVVESASVNRENAIGSKHPNAAPFSAMDEPAKSDGMRLEGFYEAADKALSSSAEPLIKGVLDRMAMSIVYGESNVGKTFVSVDMGFHIAANRPWAGRKTRHGAVVYVAAEGGIGVYKRLSALRKHYPDVGDVPFFIIKFPIDLLHGAEHGKALVELCREAASRAGLPLELIVIDTLSRAMSGGDENSSTDMGAMVKSFDALREVTGAHLQVIHHSGKDRAKGARGHSLLRAATDTEIEIERGRITVTKQRDMDGEFKHAFHLTNVTIGRDVEGASVTSCVVTLTNAKGPVLVPATADEDALATQLRDRLERTGEPHFDAQFVRETYLELAWSRGNSDPAIYKVLQTLQTKGLVKKLQPGQYVMTNTPTLQGLQK